MYDGTQPVCEYDGTATLTATNSFGPDGLLSQYNGNTVTFYTFDERGNVSERVNTASTSGGPKGPAVSGTSGSSSSGSVSAVSEVYDAFGTRTAQGAQSEPWGYGAQAGYYTDSETGLILCTHRYFDPSNGRWLTRDPISYRGGVNLYGYCQNDPGNRVDASGYLSWQAIVGINVGIVLGWVSGAVIAVRYYGPNPVAVAVGVLAGGVIGGGIGGQKGESLSPSCTPASISDAGQFGLVSGVVSDILLVVVVISA